MLDRAPEKIRLIPDDWHIQHVGRRVDGRLFWVDGQLDPAGGATKDFVCTFIFDQDGRLIQHSIELIGARGSYPEGSVGKAMDRHVATEEGEWRVEFMPGNTLSFFAPWEAGEYDT
jgi:hypothetical protein